MAGYTDPRSGDPIPDEIVREPIKPPPGALDDRGALPPVHRAGPSTTSILVGVLALVAVVFVFLGMDNGTPPPPVQQMNEAVEPATPAPGVPTPPGQTTVQ
jgi:hypothetical protein